MGVLGMLLFLCVCVLCLHVSVNVCHGYICLCVRTYVPVYVGMYLCT